MRKPVLSIRLARGYLVTAGLLSLAAFPATAQQLDRAALERWLAGYEQAWETRSADRAAALFTPDGRYHEMPFDAPKQGRASIREYWSAVTADQRNIDFTYDVVAIDGERGVAHWHAKFEAASTGAMLELDGVFVLTIGTDGLCRELREWWHLKGP
jgi:uncharacterized protein (TIGR02246 family)